MEKLRMYWMLVAVVVACLASVAPPASAAMDARVQLSRPASDDAGHFVALKDQRTMPVMGYVASGIPVTAIAVNGTPAYMYPTTYGVIGAPEGMPTFGFRVPLTLDPEDSLVVTVTTADGASADFPFTPDSVDTLSRLRRLEQLQTENYWLRLSLANAYVCYDDWDDAWPLYNWCTAYRPDWFPGYYYWGLAYLDLDDWWSADERFERGRRIDPDDVPMRLDRAEEWRERGDRDRAEAEFRDISGRHPNLAEAHWRLGETLHDAGHRDQAVSEFRQAVTDNPKLAAAHYSLGSALAGDGKRDEGVRELQQAVTIKPNYTPAQVEMGHVLWQQGKTQEAQQAYQKAVDTNPRWAPAQYGLGTTLEHQGKTDEAMRHYLEAVQVSPQYNQARDRIIQNYMSQKQYDQAWRQVQVGKEWGYHPSSQTMGQLRSAMPEPHSSPQLSSGGWGGHGYGRR